MTTEEAKNIRIADYLHSLGYSPVKQQGANLSTASVDSKISFLVNPNFANSICNSVASEAVYLVVAPKR